MKRMRDDSDDETGEGFTDTIKDYAKRGAQQTWRAVTKGLPYGMIALKHYLTVKDGKMSDKALAVMDALHEMQQHKETQEILHPETEKQEQGSGLRDSLPVPPSLPAGSTLHPMEHAAGWAMSHILHPNWHETGSGIAAYEHLVDKLKSAHDFVPLTGSSLRHAVLHHEKDVRKVIREEFEKFKARILGKIKSKPVPVYAHHLSENERLQSFQIRERIQARKNALMARLFINKADRDEELAKLLGINDAHLAGGDLQLKRHNAMEDTRTAMQAQGAAPLPIGRPQGSQAALEALTGPPTEEEQKIQLYNYGGAEDRPLLSTRVGGPRRRW